MGNKNSKATITVIMDNKLKTELMNLLSSFGMTRSTFFRLAIKYTVRERTFPFWIESIDRKDITYDHSERVSYAVRIDKNLKTEFQDFLSILEMNAATFLLLTAKQAVREQELPLWFTKEDLEDGKHNGPKTIEVTSLRTTENTKTEFQQLLLNLGMANSTFFTLVAKQTIKEQALPFQPKIINQYDYDQPKIINQHDYEAKPAKNYASIYVRLEENLKAELQNLLSALGMEMTTFFMLAVKQAIKEQALPFQPKIINQHDYEAKPAKNDEYIHVRLEENLKAELQNLLLTLGMSMATFFTLAVKQTIREQVLPFRLDLKENSEEK